MYDYTKLTLAELVAKIGKARFFHLPKMVEEALRKLSVAMFSDAPNDGNQYARQDGEWTEVGTSAGGIESVTGDFVDNTDTLNPIINVNETNLGQVISERLSIKSTPSFNDEIVMLDSITGEAVTAYFSSFRPFKVYTALLTQSGTNAPVVSVLENTIGDIVWTRSASGLYVATLTGAFTSNKTFTSATFSFEDAREGNKSIGISANGVNQVQLRTSDSALGGQSVDNLMTEPTSIEIRVYNQPSESAKI